jgi:hypothetical protein
MRGHSSIQAMKMGCEAHYRCLWNAVPFWNSNRIFLCESDEGHISLVSSHADFGH